ncbi:MAG: hypothetical protein KDD15_02615 [Lewinella sp.]|nr:hypothetical protein [Lewinella sp.]
MNILLKQPYKILWLTIPLIFLICIFGWYNTVDLQLHDKYFIFEIFHLGILLSSILSIMGLLYWLVRNKKLVQWMTMFHLTTTLFCVVVLLIAALLISNTFVLLYQPHMLSNIFILLFILVIVLGQVFFLINLIISSIRNVEKKG